MKRVYLTAVFTVDVPDGVDTDDLTLDIHDYETLSVGLASDRWAGALNAEVITHYTASVEVADA